MTRCGTASARCSAHDRPHARRRGHRLGRQRQRPRGFSAAKPPPPAASPSVTRSSTSPPASPRIACRAPTPPTSTGRSRKCAPTPPAPRSASAPAAARCCPHAERASSKAAQTEMTGVPARHSTVHPDGVLWDNRWSFAGPRCRAGQCKKLGIPDVPIEQRARHLHIAVRGEDDSEVDLQPLRHVIRIDKRRQNHLSLVQPTVHHQRQGQVVADHRVVRCDRKCPAIQRLRFGVTGLDVQRHGGITRGVEDSG